MSKSNSNRIYKINFCSQSDIYEIYASEIAHNPDMYGFIEVSELIFGNNSQVVVDPAEEKLKSEFAGVKRTFIPMHAVIRIDEVEKEGVAKIRASEKSNNIHQFPMPAYPPDPTNDK